MGDCDDVGDVLFMKPLAHFFFVILKNFVDKLV